MKFLKHFFVIILVSFIGEVLSHIIPLPIPAGIYGIVLMFIGLLTKVIPYNSVKDTAHFLVEIMPVMFIPAAVGLINSWDVISSSWLKYLIIILSTTVVVMAVSGRVTQYVIRKKEGKR